MHSTTFPPDSNGSVYFNESVSWRDNVGGVDPSEIGFPYLSHVGENFTKTHDESNQTPTAMYKPIVIELNSVSWLLALYSGIFLLAMVGNLLVIFTLVQNKRMRTITNLFLLNLAVSDLFLGVFCMPFTLVGTILRNFIFGEIMCKLLPFLQGKFL